MILQSWAEQLLQTPCAPDAIELHVKDTLAAFLAGLRTEEGQALAGLYGGRTDPAELAAAAAGIARLSECDDIHLPSCVTPGSVVIPVALAFAEGCGADAFNRAVSAGYAAGLRLGIGIGGARALAGGVWPTLLAAPLMAAVTASCLKGHDPVRLAHAMALALAGTSGRIGRPSGVPSGRWFLLAEAVARGLRASVAAKRGFRGDLALIGKSWLRAQAGHDDVDMAALEPSTTAPSLSEAGFKPFPVARQAANAIAAFQSLLSKGLDPRRIDSVEVFVPTINVALLSRPVLPDDRLSRLANMGYQIACAAFAPDMLYDAEREDRPDVPLMEFARRVSVTPASDLDAHLPNRWPARIAVHAGSDRFEETVIGMRFDHDAPGLPERLDKKWRRLLAAGDMGGLFGEAGPERTAPERRATLWQGIERRVSIAAQLRGQPKPGEG